MVVGGVFGYLIMGGLVGMVVGVVVGGLVGVGVCWFLLVGVCDVGVMYVGWLWCLFECIMIVWMLCIFFGFW